MSEPGESIERVAHALVVGGTGMLAPLSLALTRHTDVVSVVARHKIKLSELAEAAQARGGSIHPIAVDYCDSTQLLAALEDAPRLFGVIERAVIWIQSTAPDAALRVAQSVGAMGQACCYFHVLGHKEVNPARASPERRTRFESLPNVHYHEVVLGFVRGPSASRWLSRGEVCQGILRAIELGAPRYIVGTVAPWSERP